METKPNVGTFFEKYGTALAVLAGAIIIAGVFAFGRGSTTPEGPAPVAQEVDIKEVKLDASPFVGSRSAKAVIAVWFDYQCRYCKQFESTTLQEVRQTYGDDVRIVYKDFQFLGPASNDAALYSRAVWEAHPDRWEEWFKGMLADGAESAKDRAGMNALSTHLGLDTSRIEKLISDKSAEYQAQIDADLAEGQSFGITGTPSAIIGTTFLSGARPFAEVKALIDAELK